MRASLCRFRLVIFADRLGRHGCRRASERGLPVFFRPGAIAGYGTRLAGNETDQPQVALGLLEGLRVSGDYDGGA